MTSHFNLQAYLKRGMKGDDPVSSGSEYKCYYNWCLSARGTGNILGGHTDLL